MDITHDNVLLCYPVSIRTYNQQGVLFLVYIIFTSAKEVMFLPGFVCEFVCEQDNLKTYEPISMK